MSKQDEAVVLSWLAGECASSNTVFSDGVSLRFSPNGQEIARKPHPYLILLHPGKPVCHYPDRLVRMQRLVEWELTKSDSVWMGFRSLCHKSRTWDRSQPLHLCLIRLSVGLDLASPTDDEWNWMSVRFWKETTPALPLAHVRRDIPAEGLTLAARRWRKAGKLLQVKNTSDYHIGLWRVYPARSSAASVAGRVGYHWEDHNFTLMPLHWLSPSGSELLVAAAAQGTDTPIYRIPPSGYPPLEDLRSFMRRPKE